MKKRLLPLLIGLGLSGLGLSNTANADDLLQIYQLAQQNDPTLNRAKADRDSAFAGIPISRANLLPQISGSISFSDSTNESPRGEQFIVVASDSENLGLDLTLNFSLYDHSNWLQLNRAEKVAQQSDANLAVAQQELISRVVRGYLAALRAVDSLEFVRAEKRSIERQLEQTKQRFEVGLTAITDVHEAQANFDNTVAQEIRAENDVELRLEELREITGKYHAEISFLNTETFDAPRPQPENVENWLEIAENKSLDLLTRKYAQEIAKEDISIAQSGRLPTLGFRANAGRNNQSIKVQGIESDFPVLDNRSLSLNLNVPIYLGGRAGAQTKQARHNYVAASEDLELTYRTTVRSVRSSFNDVRANISTIRAFEQAVVSAESALKATEAGFEVGTRTIVDVLNSTRNLFDARRNLAGARYDYIQAVVDLKRAAGTLTEQDLVGINQGLVKK
ncbi:outer membrane channel protein TolC [Alteromonadaceae bacterium M269]|nr:outer membrane channel protein TolC [Alteromonadaceae bacterium M269]